jgi:hypothetical protein
MTARMTTRASDKGSSSLAAGCNRHPAVSASGDVRGNSFQEGVTTGSTGRLVGGYLPHDEGLKGVGGQMRYRQLDGSGTLRSLARRIRELTTEAADHRQAILGLVRAWRPRPAGPARRGPDRGRHRVCAWSHAGRCRSGAAFAMVAGRPIPASSGQTIRVRFIGGRPVRVLGRGVPLQVPGAEDWRLGRRSWPGRAGAGRRSWIRARRAR